jgi:hypothetical protein
MGITDVDITVIKVITDITVVKDIGTCSRLHALEISSLSSYQKKTTKLILLDSLLQEVVATLPHLVFQRESRGPRLVKKRCYIYITMISCGE